jgi:NAD+ synthase
MKKTASTLLSIDEERAVSEMGRYLRDLCSRHSARGILVGLSGGLDSAVLACLAAHSFSEDNVHAMYLYDQDCEYWQGSNVQRVADWVGIMLETESIEPARGVGCIYATRGMRITRVSPWLNRFICRMYHVIARETPFVSSLRAGGGQARDGGPRIPVLRVVDRYAEELFYARHRVRRKILEAKAKVQDWLLLGAANRSEWETGWFVKDGVDDLPHQPLLGLYKTQVKQLASYLGMPDELQRQVPSPDMVRGISDEYALGMRYSTIDLGLDYLSGGVSSEEVKAAGVTGKELQRIRELKELSSWKRRSMTGQLPVDGGRNGGYRLLQCAA